MTIRMIKSSQFDKIGKQAQSREETFFRFIKRAGWKSAGRLEKNLKNLIKDARLLGTSEYSEIVKPFDEHVIRYVPVDSAPCSSSTRGRLRSPASVPGT